MPRSGCGLCVLFAVPNQQQHPPRCNQAGYCSRGFQENRTRGTRRHAFNTALSPNPVGCGFCGTWAAIFPRKPPKAEILKWACCCRHSPDMLPFSNGMPWYLWLHVASRLQVNDFVSGQERGKSRKSPATWAESPHLFGPFPRAALRHCSCARLSAAEQPPAGR